MDFYVADEEGFFLFEISNNKSFQLNILNILLKSTTKSIENPPPITAEKKLLNKCKQIFEMK